MKFSVFHRTDSVTLCLWLFAGMLLLFFLGKLLSRYRAAPDEVDSGMKSLQGALLALMGLILAFSFGISGSRYDHARTIMVEEANDIGTAVLRSDLYNDSVRREFRADFKLFVEARIHLYEKAADTANYFTNLREMQRIQERLWERATSQSKLPNMLIPSGQMIPALNAMFDIAVSRDVLLRTQVPDLILYMLFILSLVSSFLTGLISGRLHFKDWIIVISFILFSTLIIYTTLDLGRPLRGFIKAESAQQAIVDLRLMFKE
jgi:hypothetical protein